MAELSSGSFGKTMLWAQYNASGRIIDRIVTKDAELHGETEGSQYVHWSNYHTGPLLQEAYFMRRLTQLKTSDYFPIIQYRSQAVFAGAGGDARFYRIYMEAAVLGDMSDMQAKQTGHLITLSNQRNHANTYLPRM